MKTLTQKLRQFSYTAAWDKTMAIGKILAALILFGVSLTAMLVLYFAGNPAGHVIAFAIVGGVFFVMLVDAIYTAYGEFRP